MLPMELGCDEMGWDVAMMPFNRTWAAGVGLCNLKKLLAFSGRQAQLRAILQELHENGDIQFDEARRFF